MKVTEYKVGEVKCIDDGETRGIIIGCEGRNLVSLVFDKGVPHKQTDELARMLDKMKLAEVVCPKRLLERVANAKTNPTTARTKQYGAHEVRPVSELR